MNHYDCLEFGLKMSACQFQVEILMLRNRPKLFLSIQLVLRKAFSVKIVFTICKLLVPFQLICQIFS